MNLNPNRFRPLELPAPELVGDTAGLISPEDKRTLDNFARFSASGFKLLSGRYYDNSNSATASGALAGAANRCDLAPFIAPETITIDRIGVNCTTLLNPSTMKIVVYGSDADGWPDARLLETSTLDTSTTGFKEATASLTFEKGKIYWLGVRSSAATAAISTVPVASAISLGLTANNATNYATIIRRTITYGDAAPSNWTFNVSELTANVTPPSIRFRVA